MIHVCHIINLTGQILPVKRDRAAWRARAASRSIVDGAHAFAHFDFKHADLDCDYYGTSLHKWLFAPARHGHALRAQGRRSAALWPLMAAPAEMDDDIRKFEEIGTHPAANHIAIAEALTFHDGIGPERKEARLRYLRDRWAKRLPAARSASGSTRASTPRCPARSATSRSRASTPRSSPSTCGTKHRIIVAPIVHEEFQGLRVTPDVYTTLDEVDRFAEAMERVIAKGLPA